MRFMIATACAMALTGAAETALAQVGNSATPRGGAPQIGPPAPSTEVAALPAITRIGPLPVNLKLGQALDEASARSQEVVAAEAELRAARNRLSQAGYRTNPELSVEFENFLGTGELGGIKMLETTVAVNQQLDLTGRRSSWVRAAQAELLIRQIRLAIVRADLAYTVRARFAEAVAARDKLVLANDTVERAQELARVATVLVNEGRDPPLRALRARSALAQAQADREEARAADLAARSLLGASLAASEPIGNVEGGSLPVDAATFDTTANLDVRLADAERAAALAQVDVQLSEARFNPTVGLGVRHVRELGDFGFVAEVSMPLPVWDRNRGNINAARAEVDAAEARRAAIVATRSAQARNATASLEAALLRAQALERSAVPVAAEAQRLAEVSYREGRLTLLELLDAQNAYTAARSSLVDARLALALAQAELARVTETGEATQ